MVNTRTQIDFSSMSENGKKAKNMVETRIIFLNLFRKRNSSLEGWNDY